MCRLRGRARPKTGQISFTANLKVTRPLAYRDVAVGIGSIWRFFDREGVRFEKTLLPSESRTGPALAQKGNGKDIRERLILQAPRPTWSIPPVRKTASSSLGLC
jgi:hypothetical protein